MDKLHKWFITKEDKDTNSENYIKARKVSDNSLYVCDELCPYYGLCNDIPDPRDIENTSKSFLDFCEQSEDGNYYIPIEGSIEEYLDKKGYDMFQSILEYNPKIEITKLIDKVCSGWCENYDPSHCNCKSTNYTCILKNLFEKEV